MPSGAVGALDVLGAAAEDGLDEVVIEQRKPPRTLLPVDEADALTEPRVVFDGTVTEVVSLYPKTTNVAAAVALAGLGFDATRARVVADPSLRANQALLTARGSFGELALRLDNVATANPRTSAITAQSVVAALRRLVSPLVVPGEAVASAPVMFAAPWVRQVTLLVTGVGCLFVGTTLLVPVVPVLAERTAGSSGAGIATAAFYFPAVCVQLAMPSLLRRVPTAPLLVTGLLLAGLPSLLYIVLAERLFAVLVVTAVRGVGFGKGPSGS